MTISPLAINPATVYPIRPPPTVPAVSTGLFLIQQNDDEASEEDTDASAAGEERSDEVEIAGGRHPPTVDPSRNGVFPKREDWRHRRLTNARRKESYSPAASMRMEELVMGGLSAASPQPKELIMLSDEGIALSAEKIASSSSSEKAGP
ncbi:MAG: hypothetical protein M1826_003887 [Phylliscum demangeonii]|nr:MAG: hypothetical protein M1826_003887 [Phylliscum demangeonii]